MGDAARNCIQDAEEKCDTNLFGISRKEADKKNVKQRKRGGE